MRVRTYIGILLGLVVVVLASYLTYQNQAFLQEPFQLGATTAVPLYVVLLAVFLVGFLPTVTLLLVTTLRSDLAQRTQRRKGREAESLRASYRRAVDLAADGQWARAASELEVVLADGSGDYDAGLLYGEVLRQLGRPDEALEVHRQAAVEYPLSVALLYQLADDYEARGEPEVAREIRSRVLREFPGMGLKVVERRRDAAICAGLWDQAVELQAQAEGFLGDRSTTGADSDLARGLSYQRAVDLLENDEVGPAVEILRAILADEPRFVPAAIMLGEAAALSGDREAAVGEWLAGYSSTGSPVFLKRIEDHFIEAEKPAAAIETLRRLIAEADNEVLPRFFLGRLYYRLEMHEEALKVLDGLSEAVGSSPTYHFLMARIRERRGEARLALESYARCARASGVPETEYCCRSCGARYPEWLARCSACGSWNSVEIDFEEERVSAAELGLQPGPVWAGPSEGDPADLE